jgi:hypothetical protein
VLGVALALGVRLGVADELGVWLGVRLGVWDGVAEVLGVADGLGVALGVELGVLEVPALTTTKYGSMSLVRVVVGPLMVQSNWIISPSSTWAEFI